MIIAENKIKASIIMLGTSKNLRFERKNVTAAARGIDITKHESIFAVKAVFLDSSISSQVYLSSGDILLK